MAGISLGVVADLLLFDSGRPGLNVFLLFLALALSVVAVARRGGLRLSGEALGWMAAGILLAGTFLLRDSPALHAMAFLAAAAAFAWPALRGGAPWLQGSGIGDQMEAVAGAILHAGLGALRLLAGLTGGERGVSPGAYSGDLQGIAAREAARGAARGRVVRGVLAGGVLALPLLLVFGALFMSADAVFAGMITGALGTLDPERVTSHVMMTATVGWLASGYLAGLLSGTRLRGALPTALPRPTLGIAEVGTILVLLDLLFGAFVLVQLRYLFGGSAVVEPTPGLTYAEYAREGFTQLVLATALVLPTLLLADWLLRGASPRGQRLFRLLGGLQLALLLVIVASAVQRLRAYQEAYGLTESRYYGAALLLWLTFVTAWFALTVLRGRRNRFAAVALAGLYMTLAGLIVLNPDVRIAQANLARAHDHRSASFDGHYLGTLGADAVPVLVDGLPRLPPEARCALARELGRRWGSATPADWRNWNLPRARARARQEEVGAWLAGCPEEALR